MQIYQTTSHKFISMANTSKTPAISFPKLTKELTLLHSLFKKNAFGSKAVRDLFMLEKSGTFLNNGSFGATPSIIMKVQQYWRERMEMQPVRFMTKELPAFQYGALIILSEFLKTDSRSLAFVDNATTGANAVIRNEMVKWKKGDEILTTNHVYGAVRTTLHYAAECTGVKIKEAFVPFPIESNQQVIDAIANNITRKTKMVVIDHITSPSGIIFPVKEIIDICKKKSVPVFVDGAHAPGMIDLNIDDLQPDWYTGNCHKWLYAPKGCAFLWTHPSRLKTMHPTIISHGFNQGYRAEFDWVGTKDYSPFLSIGPSLEFYRAAGDEKLRTYFHEKAIEIRAMLCAAWKTKKASPDEMIGSLAGVKVPKHLYHGKANHMLYAEALHDVLLYEYGIEVPVIAFNNETWIRISVQIFNQDKQYALLAETVNTIKRKDILEMMKTIQLTRS